MTGRRLTVSAVESMGDNHAIAEALVEVGVEHEPVLGQLLTTVAPPRAAIVRPRVGEA